MLNFQKANVLYEKNQLAESKKELNSIFNELLISNYFPLMHQVLFLRSNINKKLKFYEDYCSDILLLISPLINNSNSFEIFESLLLFLKDIEPITIPIPPPLIPLLPIKLEIFYDSYEIVAGNKPQIILKIISYLPDIVKFDDIMVFCDHIPGQLIGESLGSLIVEPKKRIFLKKFINIPPAVSNQTINSVLLSFNNLKIKIDQNFGLSLKVSPDASACMIDVKMPERCITGALLPFSINLTAGDQKLNNLSIDFIYDEKIYPIKILNKNDNNNEILKNNHFDNIEPNQSLNLDLYIQSLMPIFTKVIMIVSFDTALSGKGDFKRPLLFNFQPPFEASVRLFDENFDECSKTNGLLLETGSIIHLETILTNNLEIPVNINSLSSNIKKIDIDGLPVTLLNGESFTFFGIINKGGEGNISIEYNAEDVGNCIFTFKCPKIQEFTRPVTFEFESPSMAIKLKEFESKIIIDRKGDDIYNELIEVNIEIERKEVQNDHSSFFYSGPVKKLIRIGRNQKKEISLKFLPLETGSMFLPKITLSTNIKDGMPKRIFKLPIVVAYQ